jgi:hypothetical protein
MYHVLQEIGYLTITYLDIIQSSMECLLFCRCSDVIGDWSLEMKKVLHFAEGHVPYK